MSNALGVEWLSESTIACRKTYVFRQPEKSPAGKFRGFGRATQVTKFSGIPAWNPRLTTPRGELRGVGANFTLLGVGQI